jgi:hypothetical protein
LLRARYLWYRVFIFGIVLGLWAAIYFFDVTIIWIGLVCWGKASLAWRILINYFMFAFLERITVVIFALEEIQAYFQHQHNLECYRHSLFS